MYNIKIKKIMFSVISLFIVVTFISGCNSPIANEKMYLYLYKNHESANNISNNFSIFDNDIKKNNVILCGECHGVKYDYKLQIKLLEYFNKKYNLKYLLMEQPYSTTCSINDYLKTGDEKILKAMFSSFKNTFSYNNDFYYFLVGLRKYNLTLAQNKRIKAEGIDIEFDILFAMKYLNSILINRGKVPDKISPAVNEFRKQLINNSLTNKDFICRQDLKTKMLDFQNDINENKNCYMKYLGKSFYDFSFILNNSINSINVLNTYYNSKNNSEKLAKGRELCIYNNFKKLYKNLPRGKYFGQFGREHIYQKMFCDGSYNDTDERFATYLNDKNSPVSGKVLSVAYSYENCYQMLLNQSDAVAKVNADSYYDDNKFLDHYAKSDITIFKLDGYNSPFNKKLYFIKNATASGVTTDYFKYIVLIRNSPGTTIYNIK